MEVYATTINHKDQRYPTAGDYVWHGDLFKITVSDTGNEDYNFLILVHELVEAYLCKKNGVQQSIIDMWDMNYKGDGEPGSADGCPYGNEHNFASLVEMAIGNKLGIDFKEYDKAIEALYGG